MKVIALHRWQTYFVLAFFLFSCSTKKEEIASRFFENGKAKPIIAITPIIDATNFDITWSLSEELTSLLYQELRHEKNFYLSSNPMDNTSSFAYNPFGSDLSWMKKTFNGQTFVVFLELVQHEKTNLKKNPSIDHPAAQLHMALRIRIVDLSTNKPTILLQELLRDSYFLPSSPADHTSWGSTDYLSSPFYHAHLQLMKEASLRIHDYILAATQR